MFQTSSRICSATVPLFAAMALLPCSAQAQVADFSWYGRLDLSLESNSNGALNRTAIQNFSSRLGIRGERSFNSQLQGIFQVETGIAPDDTTQSKSLASRNSFVGIKSGQLGTLLVGTHDMPLKTLEGTAYALWGEGDLQELIIHGKASRVAIGSSVIDNVHTRKTNVLLYTSPKMNHWVFKLAYSPDEAKVAASGSIPSYDKDMVGASLEFDNGMFNVGLATQSQNNFIAPTSTTGGSSMKGTKFTTGIKWGQWTGGVATSTLNNGRGKKVSNSLITTTYQFDSIVLKASMGSSGESSSGANDSVSATAFEVDYKLDKSTTFYSYFAQIKNAANAKGTFAAADNFPAVVTAGNDPRAFGLGIRYNF